MDSFFSKGFKAAKCKTLMKLTIPRVKLLRNRREIQIKQMRREIAKLLETGQEATARIRVEHIIREEKMMAAQEIVELFCELITVRLPIIEAQKECPLDLKEAISSVCFAAPRCADLPELQQVQVLFASKYGKDFMSSATELMPECGVNRQLVELLSVRAPAPDVKLKLLKEIAEEHELDWDPNASESELMKTHEDLLNGPTQFLKSQREEVRTTELEAAPNEHTESDEDFDIIDFPEVPRQPLQLNKERVSTPEMLPFPASALSDSDDQEEPNPSADKQFVPFIHPPSQQTVSFPVIETRSPPSITKSENDDAGLRDILTAAETAAETAERAAAAARSAATLVQLRITELMKTKKNDEDLSSYIESPFHLEKPKMDLEEKVELDVQNSFDDAEGDADSSSHSNNAFGHGSLYRPQRLPSMDEETYFSYPNLFATHGSNQSSLVQSFRGSR